MFAYYSRCVLKYYFSLGFRLSAAAAATIDVHCAMQRAHIFPHCSFMALVNFSFRRFVLIWMRHLLLLVPSLLLLLQLLSLLPLLQQTISFWNSGAFCPSIMLPPSLFLLWLLLLILPLLMLFGSLFCPHHSNSIQREEKKTTILVNFFSFISR